MIHKMINTYQFRKEKMDNNDKQLIVECLLFAASVQVCANWDAEKQKRMVELAKILKVEPSEDIEFWKDDYEKDEPWASQIPKHFDIKITGIDSEESEESTKEKED